MNFKCLNFEQREPKVGDLVLFDITWSDTLNSGGHDQMQYGIVTMIKKRARRAWDQYVIEWNGEDLLFFGNLDRIEIIGE